MGGEGGAEPDLGGAEEEACVAGAAAEDAAKLELEAGDICSGGWRGSVARLMTPAPAVWQPSRSCRPGGGGVQVLRAPLAGRLRCFLDRTAEPPRYRFVSRCLIRRGW